MLVVTAVHFIIMISCLTSLQLLLLTVLYLFESEFWVACNILETRNSPCKVHSSCSWKPKSTAKPRVQYMKGQGYRKHWLCYTSRSGRGSCAEYDMARQRCLPAHYLLGLFLLLWCWWLMVMHFALSVAGTFLFMLELSMKWKDRSAPHVMSRFGGLAMLAPSWTSWYFLMLQACKLEHLSLYIACIFQVSTFVQYLLYFFAFTRKLYLYSLFY